MLFKDLLLDYLFLLLKGIQQIECDGTVGVMVPDLYKINPRPVMKERIIQIEALLFPLYLFPVSRIKTQITARAYVGVHSFQCH